MLNKLLVNPIMLSAIIGKVHDDNLPVTISTGKQENGLIEVLFEYPDLFNENFDSLMDDTFNEVFNPILTF